ncbi:MAG: deoxyhypusine synthase [Ignavibacteria bacterium GWA2_55_11]|nr:MAG: deoxyhypusine synthase [Ignavibacteria bacterium GWA2_55_11]OGU43316.1 MAG: deoxyhypusine synthase [Ignavibacteria bacterium GWC2_56_12]OGU63155.1 MAG: deoxyhypusine synthase [Ignavibacteria bacterium RIFCSPHIGHO2_02_FULL_56_12]OGU70586.1 MAG: deoxyhypusine synthase [Ignavibacteria bacterium RIFCSPLOWO2_12_FULL_56_21]OGU73011.1 MAG: deoxyhypusine synthase [Ignavibacteria bacterium RIFCSPLOWO2_02_FULL_55_14]
MKRKSRYLSGTKIDPRPIKKNVGVVDLIDKHFQAYNAARLREAAQLFATKMLQSDVTIGMSLTGALTPAGLGGTCIVPLMKAGFVDWIVSTGANLYHDTHFAIGKTLHRGSPFIDDRNLRKEGVIRIYDILFDYDVLLDTDAFFRRIIEAPEFQKDMSTAEFHYKVGKYVYERERYFKLPFNSVLGTAYTYAVPVYTSSPGDSSIGMNVAAQALYGNMLRFDPLADVNETAAIVLQAKRSGGRSGVLIFGGGSPKNFILQTEPQIQEVLHIDERGHDFFVQVTDARPDTGGLSGATPSEAVSWGKIDPDKLPDTVVAYIDSTIAMPLMTSYALAKRRPRKPRRLYDRLDEMMSRLKKEADKVYKKY